MKFGRAMLVAAGMLFLLGAHAFAQVTPAIDKGAIEVGSTVGFDYSSASPKEGDAKYKITTIMVTPRVGYFVTKNIEVEVDVLFLYDKEQVENGTTTSASNTHFGALARCAYNLIREGAAVPYGFLGVGVLTNSHSTDDTYVPPGEFTAAVAQEEPKLEETSLILPAAGVGVKFFLSDKAGIRVEAMYARFTNHDGVKDLTANDISLQAGLTMLVK